MKRTTMSAMLVGLLGSACSAATDIDGRPGGGGQGDAGAADTGETNASGVQTTQDAGGGTGDESDESNATTDASDSNQSDVGGDVDTTSTSDPDAGMDPIAPPEEACSPGIPPTSQIPRLSNHQYDAVVRDLLGVTTVTDAEVRPSSLLAPDDQDPMSDHAWAAYLNLAEQIAGEVMAGPLRVHFMSCEPAEEGCLETTIESFGRKAFRRPLTAEEVARFMRFDAVEPKGTADEGAEAVLLAFLVSPSFILLPELSADADPTTGAFALSDYEVATRLSLLIWGGLPDDVLNQAADGGELRTAEQVLAQAERMIEDRERTAPQLIAAHRAYARVGPDSRWGVMDHDPDLYPAPASKDDVNATMMAELDAFFEEVAYEGSYADLFTSNAAFVNAATAPIYGLDASTFGSELVRVELDASDRPGFLTRLAFLSSHSLFGATSPIIRGAYILRNILDVDIPAPPANVSPTPMPPGMYATNREYVEALTGSPQCAACHRIINPPGFVLEAYDAIGALQTQDAMGGPIDPVADVMLATDEVQTMRSPLELMAAIAQSRVAQRRYAREWVSFATQRSPNPNDECVVETLSEKLSDDDYAIKRIPVELTQADFFRWRTRD